MTVETILVVEDDIALQTGVRDMLELAGYEVLTASNGNEGLSVLGRRRPSLVLSDVTMPHMNGFEFYQAMRNQSEWLDIPFIFLTARGDKHDIRYGKALGADDYLIKPFDYEDLVIAIRNKLNRHAQIASARNQHIHELKRSILTTLNHEFRTPLTHITTYTDMLKDTDPTLNPADFRTFLLGIQNGSARLLRLVEDFILLVEFQMGEAQETYVRRREVLADLVTIVSTVLFKYTEIARRRNVTLKLDLPAQLPLVLGDREYLSNATSRLVDNAIKFSKPEGGTVTLGATATAAQIDLYLQDEGVGIRADALAHIFDLFSQPDRHIFEQQGIGAGLTIANEIVHLHNGKLLAHSILGEGSVFTIQLPIITQPVSVIGSATLAQVE